MNNLRSFSEFNNSAVSEAAFFTKNKSVAAVPSKEKSSGKAQRDVHRAELMQKRKEILGKISKIKSNLDNTPAPTTTDVKAAPVMAPAVQAQLESLRKELKKINKMLS